MGFVFVANFIGFPAVQKFKEIQLRFDKVTESLTMGTFLRHSVYIMTACQVYKLQLSIPMTSLDARHGYCSPKTT